MADPLPPLPGGATPLEAWDGEPVERLAAAWGAPRVLAFERVGSTNDVARALAQAGWPEGSCVVAEEQTAGRGRGAKRWTSPPGVGLYLSIVLRPGDAVAPGALPLLVGTAVAAAVEPMCAPARTRVKWPNDVLVDGRKVCGILCEGAWEGPRLSFVVAGIGVNVGQRPEAFAPEVRDLATSLRIAGGSPPPRGVVAGEIVRALAAALAGARAGAPPLAGFARWDALRGETVRVAGAGGAGIVGEAAGVTAEGSLLVRVDGALREVRSGTVRLERDGSAAPEPGHVVARA